MQGEQLQIAQLAVGGILTVLAQISGPQLFVLLHVLHLHALYIGTLVQTSEHSCHMSATNGMSLY